MPCKLNEDGPHCKSCMHGGGKIIQLENSGIGKFEPEGC